ncbi:MAG: DUF6550 family protein [Ethanoligenens sp.]
MKKLSERSKKMLAVAGISVACVVLIIGISFRFSAEGAKSTGTVTPSSSASDSISVAAIGTDSGSAQSSAPSSSVPTSSQAPASSQAESSSKADQVIQPNVSKSAAPSSKPQAQGSTTDPSKKPTYSSQDTTPSQGSDGQNFQKKDGKIYVPGFGWVTNNGGGGSGKTVDGSGDINKQVGQMD